MFRSKVRQKLHLKKMKESLLWNKTLLYTPANQHLWLCHNGEEVSCCCKIDGRLTENMTRHDLDREK